MKRIKFSHRYLKMPFGLSFTKTLLVNVSIVNLEDLPKEFIDYDTRYNIGKALYPLPKKGKYMVLLLLTGNEIWTTIRRWTPRKFDYYKGLIGQEVKIKLIK